MKKTVVRTVFATLFVEAVIALIVVLYITGGRIEFGPLIREADRSRRTSQLFGQEMSEIPVPSYILRGGGPPLPANVKHKKFNDWKWQDKMWSGSYEEWLSTKNLPATKGDKATVPNWK